MGHLLLGTQEERPVNFFGERGIVLRNQRAYHRFTLLHGRRAPVVSSFFIYLPKRSTAHEISQCITYRWKTEGKPGSFDLL